MKDVTYTVQARSGTGTRIDVSARDFTMVIDEPKRLGGTNAGPNPLEYELAALAGCLNVTGHMVAGELGITIENLTMELAGSLNPARFMGRSEEDRAGFKEITAKLNLTSSADPQTLEKWRTAVEERCPVSDNLSNGTTLNIRIEEDQ